MTANKPEVEENEQRVAEGDVEQPPKLQNKNEKEASDNNMDTNNEAGTSSSSSNSNNKEEMIKKATNALVQGKRHFFMKDIPSAVAALEDACRLQVEIYGPLSSEHAEAHFYFGRALLEQARLDLAVFDAPNASAGDTTNGKSDEEDSDEDDDEDEEGEGGAGGEDEEMEQEEEEAVPVASESESKEPSSNDTKPIEPNENDQEVESSSSSSKVSEDVNKPSSSSSSTALVANDDEQPSTSKGGNMSTLTETVEDEPNNLELAWEVLELAKLGYQKQLDNVQMNLNDFSINDEEKIRLQKTLDDIKRKLADTHSLLGEVGTESEIYQQAIEDFKTAITIYADVEEEDSREIAQIKFQIGLTYGLEKKWKESIESLQESAEMIQKRIDNLKNKLTQLSANPNSEATNPSTTNLSNERENIEKEIQELTELLPELKEKINDTIEQEKDLKKVEEEEKMEQEIMERNSPVKKPPPAPAKPLDSGLIKRKEKRKVELESVPLTGQVIDGAPLEFGNEEPPTKKPCTDSSSIETPVSLTTSTTTTTNGHAKPE